MTKLVPILILMCIACLARQDHRYPYDNFADSGKNLGTHQSVRSFIPLAATTFVDPTFSQEQMDILSQAMGIVVDQAMRPDVIDCAYAHSNRDMPQSRKYFEKQLYEVFTWRRLGNLFYPASFYIARYWNDSSVGIGYVGLFYDTDMPLPGFNTRRYVHIALNSDYIGSSSNYLYRQDEYYWAGVIAHEMLHNLGHRHPNGYPGSFIDEYGNCLAGYAPKSATSEKLVEKP